MNTSINPDSLKYHREKKNLTQLQLAEICKCSPKTISRWEQGEGSNIRNRLREALEKSLDVAWESLTRPPASRSDTDPELQPSVQVNTRMRPDIRNALQAVCMRYNVSPRTVLEYAPLLFLITAERSLSARRTAADQCENALYGAYDEMMERAQHLGGYSPNMAALEAIEEERDSINKRDLFMDDGPVLDHDQFNPFVNHLNQEAEDLPEGAVGEIAPRYFGVADYEIATDTIATEFSLDLSKEQDQRFQTAMLLGSVELNKARNKRKELSESKFLEWFDETMEASKTSLDRSIDDILEGVDIGQLKKNEVIDFISAMPKGEGE
tara:strand:+ start:30800 stop:31771 length:972 start_codon:yes stop_codon:yes gene_type:complete